MKESRCCYSCTWITHNWEHTAPFLCSYCGCDKFSRSEDFEHELSINQQNKEVAQRIQDYLDGINQEIETFEKHWELSWNSGKDEQLMVEPSKLYEHLLDN